MADGCVAPLLPPCTTLKVANLSSKQSRFGQGHRTGRHDVSDFLTLNRTQAVPNDGDTWRKITLDFHRQAGSNWDCQAGVCSQVISAL